MDSAQLRREQGRAAREHAEQCFDTRVSSRRVIELYEGLLAS